MTPPDTPITVDRERAYFRTGQSVTGDYGSLDAGYDAVDQAIDAARADGRKVVLVEVTVRVAPR